MVSYKMRMHTCPLDEHRKSVERCSLFRMSPRDMAIACLSWWEPQKSSWQILTFSKYRPATSWPSCCMMVACITVAEKKLNSVERSGIFRSAVAATCYGCQVACAMLPGLSCEIITFVGQKIHVRQCISLRKWRVRVAFLLELPWLWFADVWQARQAFSDRAATFRVAFLVDLPCFAQDEHTCVYHVQSKNVL